MDQGVEEFPITFAPEKKLSAKSVRAAANENNFFAPNTKWDEELIEADIAKIHTKLAPTEDDMDEYTPTLSIDSIRKVSMG